jgi:hypothetical protein
MTPKEKNVRFFVKRLIKDSYKKADLRTLKIYEFTDKRISYSFLFETKKMTCSYMETPAEELYNLFLEVKQEIEKL